jgi:RNA polymerase sigma factor (TIGR02999 family)
MGLVSFSRPLMSHPGDSKVSDVLQAAQAGDRQAVEDLLPLVYSELHELARARLARQPPGQTLTPTALVNEVYVRVAGGNQVTWEGRQHFLFAAARSMRDILVEQARRKAGPNRGGGQRRRELDEACAVLEPPSDDVLAVHEALEELEVRDPLKAQIVLLRYFTGLTRDETAAVLGLAERTLDRHWRYIRAWLKQRLS